MMKTSILHGPLPPEVGLKFDFEGERTLDNACLRSVSFHGAIVDINPEATADGWPPLGERQKQVLTLNSIGLLQEETGTALNIAAETVKSHLQVAYRKLDVTGQNAGGLAVGRCFETGFFVVRQGIDVGCENPDDAHLAGFIAEGGIYPAFRRLNGEKIGTRRFAGRAFKRFNVANQNGLAFLAYVAGWLPLQQEVEMTG